MHQNIWYDTNVETTICTIQGGMPMSHWFGWLIALVSTAVCLILWFRDVRQIMLSRRSTVESAEGQLKAYRQKAGAAQDDPEAEAVLARSEKIYRQAVELYEQTRKKPLVYLPALLMGFWPIT